jgi:hypothetical protein
MTRFPAKRKHRGWPTSRFGGVFNFLVKKLRHEGDPRAFDSAPLGSAGLPGTSKAHPTSSALNLLRGVAVRLWVKPGGTHILRVLESPAMVTVEEAIVALSKLLDEAQAFSSHYRSPMFSEQLELWSKRAEAKLRQWGLLEEAGRFGSAREDGNFHDRQDFCTASCKRGRGSLRL